MNNENGNKVLNNMEFLNEFLDKIKEAKSDDEKKGILHDVYVLGYDDGYNRMA